MYNENDLTEIKEPSKKDLKGFDKEIQRIYNEGLNVEHIFDIDEDDEEFIY
jgi:hypothetical protein